MFLHANMMHLLWNVIATMILGFRLEPTVGFWHMSITYVISALGGNLMSCLCAPDVISVGASTAIFGLTTSMMMYLFINWNALDPISI
mmetsp:Transcript_11937/g.6002  ORF Transcript_11937/g.6002 Transcript_11937/m.6002 type:complete len:88 (+) Transcript_11937:325-588(+)